MSQEKGPETEPSYGLTPFAVNAYGVRVTGSGEIKVELWCNIL
jgi:hypothetical protein